MKDNEFFKIIAENLKINISHINYNTEMQNTKEWDSLNHIKIIIALSKKYKIKIQTSDYDKLTSISSIKKFLNNKI